MGNVADDLNRGDFEASSSEPISGGSPGAEVWFGANEKCYFEPIVAAHFTKLIHGENTGLMLLYTDYRGRKDSTGQVEKDVACRGGQEAS